MEQKQIYLLGNPNCGKTSLFNAITGERLHVGNWPGVTVQKIEGITHTPEADLVITDLPGTYSLTPATPEEKVVLDCLDEAVKGQILNVVDISNFERNLLLTTQLTELGLKPVISLNCYDLFTSNGGEVNLQQFSSLTGLDAYPTVARNKTGVQSLIEGLASGKPRHMENDRVSVLDFSDDWKEALKQAADAEGHKWSQMPPLSRNQLIEDFIKPVDSVGNEKLDAVRNDLAVKLSAKYKRDIHAHDLSRELANDRYERIASLLKECAKVPLKTLPKWQESLDKVLTNKFLGFPILILMLLLVFWTTFTVGQYPMDWLSAGVEWLAEFVSSKMSDGLLKSLIVDGIIQGVGGVIVFLPNILILFFWIALLEDSGYMSRAAFMMDSIMKSMGLQGRAFIPMIMGIGCNVPAIMATRIIDSKFQRLLTIMLIPLVSCSARLPVLVLLCGTFFPENPSKWMLFLFLLNLLVILFLGHFTGLIFGTKENSFFLLEMPPYRLPTVKSVYDILKDKAMHFIQKAGTIIFAGSIVIWALSSFPRDVKLSFDYDAAKAAIETSQSSEADRKVALDKLESKKAEEEMEGRYMARLGKFMHPVMAPLKFTWRETVSLIPGFLAKESVVSTLTVLYKPVADSLPALKEGSNNVDRTGEAMKSRGMTPLKAFTFMMFTLLYIPCLATFGIMWRESGSAKFTILSMVTYLVIAYVASFGCMKLGEILDPSSSPWDVLTITVLAICAAWYLLRMGIGALKGKLCETCGDCKSCSMRGSDGCKCKSAK